MKQILFIYLLSASFLAKAQKEKVYIYKYYWQCQKCGETLNAQLRNPSEVNNLKIRDYVKDANSIDLLFIYRHVDEGLDSRCEYTGNKHIWKKSKGERTDSENYIIDKNGKVEKQL